MGWSNDRSMGFCWAQDAEIGRPVVAYDVDAS